MRPCHDEGVTPFLRIYASAWLLFGALAVAVAIRGVRVPLRDSLRFMAAPWKVALFVPAIAFVTFAGRFTDDETWDVVSGGGMAVLTAATAWWSVGTLARLRQRATSASHALVAVFVALFSSSWFYDGYLYLRDGAYTHRWLGNLMISPVIYLCAGVLSNLEIRDGRLALAFTRGDWPKPGPRGVRWPLVLAALPLVALAAYGLVGAVGWRSPFGP